MISNSINWYLESTSCNQRASQQSFSRICDGDKSVSNGCCKLMSSLIKNASCILFQRPLFMVRVAGSTVYFYSHRFSNCLLDSVSKGTEPMESTYIQKLSVVKDNTERHGFSLLDPDDRARIFKVLNCIQQIIARFWSRSLIFVW